MLFRRSLTTLSASARYLQKHLSTSLYRSLSLSVSPAFNRSSPSRLAVQTSNLSLSPSSSPTTITTRSLATMAEQGQAKIIDGNATAAYVLLLLSSVSHSPAKHITGFFCYSPLISTVPSVKVSHNVSPRLDPNSLVSNLTSQSSNKALDQILQLISK